VAIRVSTATPTSPVPFSNRLHPFDHRPFQPSPCVLRQFRNALNDYLIVCHNDRNSAGPVVPTLPQERKRQVQAVCCGSLDQGVESVGENSRAYSYGASNWGTALELTDPERPDRLRRNREAPHPRRKNAALQRKALSVTQASDHTGAVVSACEAARLCRGNGLTLRRLPCAC
jgi:hypothetical protein